MPTTTTEMVVAQTISQVHHKIIKLLMFHQEGAGTVIRIKSPHLFKVHLRKAKINPQSK